MTERRLAPRLDINVEMEGRKNGDVFEGTSVNVSETGILIETNKSLSLGDVITIRLVSPGVDDIVGIGKVVRSEELGWGKLAYAVKWDLTIDQKQALRQMVQSGKK